MTRNPKALGLAVVAALAMSAVMASTASANHLAFQATGEPTVWLNGSDEEPGKNTFTTTAGTVHCQEAAYAITIPANTTPTTRDVGAAYADCEVTPAMHAIIDMNGCIYQLHAGETDANKKMEGTVDIICPAGKEITITATVGGTVKCTIHVKEQKGLTQITYTNIGAGEEEEITLDLALGGIHYTHTKGTGFGACNPGTANNGAFNGQILLEGENEETEEQVGVKMVHEPH